jgi:hypothetical protein
MKKISSTASHLGIIGLALLALLVATVVWLVERARGRDSGQASQGAEPELDAVRAGSAYDALNRGASLACEEEAAGDGMML